MALAEERETVIRISDADDQWDIYSASSKVMNRMEKAGFEAYKTDSEGNKYYKVGYEQVSFRKKSDSKRVMSDERRAALAANLAKGRANKKKKSEEA
jgi:hypothetical protein